MRKPKRRPQAASLGRAKPLGPTARAKPVTGRDRATAGLILDLLTNEIHRLKGGVGRGMFEIGVRLSRILEERLWEARGYQSFEDYLERGVSFSRSTGYKLMRISRHFSAEIAERYGVEKLELGLRYLETTPVRERPGDLVAAEMRVRDASGRFRSISFHEATPMQIRDAIGLLSESRSVKRLPESLEKRVERVAAGLTAPPTGVHRGPRVVLKRGTDGQYAVTFHAIALDDLQQFLALVEQHLLGAKARR